MYINLSYQLYFLFQGNICIIMVIDETSVFTVISFRLYKIVNTCKKIHGWGWLSISYLLWGVILCSVLVGSFFLSNFADNHVGRAGGRAADAGRGEQEGELHPWQSHLAGGERQPYWHSGDMQILDWKRSQESFNFHLLDYQLIKPCDFKHWKPNLIEREKKVKRMAATRFHGILEKTPFWRWAKDPTWDHQLKIYVIRSQTQRALWARLLVDLGLLSWSLPCDQRSITQALMHSALHTNPPI